MTFVDRVSWLRKLAPNRPPGTDTQPSRHKLAPMLGNSSPTLRRGNGDAAPGRLLPRFHSTASDRVESRNSDKVSAARLGLRDAWTPAQPITDPWRFSGRTELLTRLIRAVEDQRLHAIIYGARGIGKTSLLHVLAGMAREARYQVSYVTCGGSANFSEMFRAVAASVPLLYHASFGPTSEEGERGATLLDLTPAGEISPQLASELCASIIGTRLLIVLDEFDRPSSPTFNRDVAEFIKNLSDRAVRVQLVVAGVAEDLQDLMHSNGVVQRNVVAIEVPRMSPDEIAQLVQRGEEVCGISFDQGAVVIVSDASAGMPYLASRLSHQAAMTALWEGRVKVTASDVAKAVTDSVDEMQARLPRRVRAFLEERVRKNLVQLGAIASFAYLSGLGISPDQVRSTFPDANGANLATEELSGLTNQGVLVRVGEADGDDLLRFKDENELLFLWLLTVRERLKTLGVEPGPDGLNHLP